VHDHPTQLRWHDDVHWAIGTGSLKPAESPEPAAFQRAAGATAARDVTEQVVPGTRRGDTCYSRWSLKWETEVIPAVKVTAVGNG
jgi:hypothetical protein